MMKICVLGLDNTAPGLIFQDERLGNLRRMMEVGVYGALQGVVPPITVPSWMCMTASQDPGSLGLYGPRTRRSYSYDAPALVDSNAVQVCHLWDHIAQEGKKSILVAVPPDSPPRPVQGISIGYSLTSDSAPDDFAYPASIQARLREEVGEYAADVKNLHASNKDVVREAIFAVSRKQWETVRWLLRNEEWDYFHFVDIGVNRIQHAFWNCFDPEAAGYQAGNPYQSVIPDYYVWLDEQIGTVMEMLHENTALLVAASYGTQRLDGALALNQWLLAEGLLVLEDVPNQATGFDQLKVNWSRTRAWSEGGDCAQIFFNVQGREPQGVIPAAEYDPFRAELKDKLLALKSDKGTPLMPQVLAPAEIYSQVHGVAPDLLVDFSAAGWRALDTVGHSGVYAPAGELENTCSHSRQGMFLLAAPNCPLGGVYQGASLLDLAPTLLDLAGYSVPSAMQGRSLVAGMEKRASFDGGDADQAKIIHDRLAGLGYV